MVFCRQVLLLAAIQLSSLAAARSFGDRLVIKPREYTNSSSSSSSDLHISSNNYIAASLETGLAPHSRSLVAVPSSDTEDSSSNSPGGPAETSRLISTKQQQVYTSDISSQITVPTATSPTATSKVTVPTSSVLSSSLSFPTFSPSGNSTTRWPNSTSSTTSSWSSDTAITRAPHTSSVLTYNSASSQSSYTIITVPPFTTSKPSTSVKMSISTTSSRNYTSSSYGNKQL
ncbi:hypothetical protein B0J14DRAFT_283904 [Halenospora varia]|nr:hypothetical protein B0J14DRAFT_283904 [Halenospora varia]